ncbi:MAG: DUF5946 family protein [bacterium]
MCEDCGAAPADVRDGCRQVFEQIIAKEFSDMRYGKVHRLTVDCYSMQHPAYILSAKSFAAHLTRLCCAMEHGRSARIYKAINRWLDGPARMQKPSDLRKAAGYLTITHIARTVTPEEHVEKVQEWAESVWAAWGGFHALARELVEAATSKPARLARNCIAEGELKDGTK